MTPSTSIVIFGVSGDLSQRKLIPALFNLFKKGRLAGDFRIFGIGGRPWSDEDLRSAAQKEFIKVMNTEINLELWNTFAARLSYHSADLTSPERFPVCKSGIQVISADPQM